MSGKMEAFIGPFHIHEYWGSDSPLWAVLDANRKVIGDFDDKPQAQWLCDRLNTTPAADVRGSVGTEVAGMVKRLRGTDWYERIQNLDFAEDGDALRLLVKTAGDAADLLERLAGEYARGIEDAAKAAEQQYAEPQWHPMYRQAGRVIATAIRALAQRPKP